MEYPQIDDALHDEKFLLDYVDRIEYKDGQYYMPLPCVTFMPNLSASGTPGARPPGSPALVGSHISTSPLEEGKSR